MARMIDNEPQKEPKDVPEAVRVSRFGCCNCLWGGCECVRGSSYIPETYTHVKHGCKSKTISEASCVNYTYCD